MPLGISTKRTPVSTTSTVSAGSFILKSYSKTHSKMPYMSIRLTQPLQAVPVNMSPQGMSNMRLISYQAEGVLAPQVIYVGIRDQSTTSVFGNTGNGNFPLIVPTGPNFGTYLQNPILFVEGNNVWNAAKSLTFETQSVSALDGSSIPAVFSLLTLLFEYTSDILNPAQILGLPGVWPGPHTGTNLDRKNLNVYYDRLP